MAYVTDNPSRRYWASALAVSLAATLAVSAVKAEEPHAGDIELNLIGNQLVLGESVLGAEMNLVGAAPNQVYYTDEPGFDSPTDTFTPGTSIGFNILAPLGLWSGSEFNDINPATGPVLNISNTVGLTTFQANTSTGFVAGHSLAVGAGGEWHKHLNFNLLGDGGVATSLAAEGIYLLVLELFSTQSGVENSDPFYIVFNNGGLALEDDHDAAITYVETSLVPEPATAVLLAGLGGVGLLRRRR